MPRCDRNANNCFHKYRFLIHLFLQIFIMKPTFIPFFLMGISFLSAQTLVINEIESDSPGADDAEFIELYSTTPNTNLDGYVLVLFNGNGDNSYAAYDLDGYSTDANGYFVIGDSGVTGISITLLSSGLQNGPDAVALYQANKSDFPNDTPVTTTNLVDAVVYDNNHPDDTALLTGLGETTQFNEDNGDNGATNSLQRQADGSFKAGAPSPNTINQVLSVSKSKISAIHIYPNPVVNTLFIDGLNEDTTVSVFSLTGQLVLRTRTNHSVDVSRLVTGVYLFEITHNGESIQRKLIKH